MNRVYRPFKTLIFTVVLGFFSITILHAQSTETNEPSMIWKYGGASDALIYSLDHEVIAFVCTIGEDATYTDEQIAQALDQNIFTGKTDVPIALFIYPDKVKDNQGAVCTAYIRGRSFRDDYTGEKNLSPQEIIDSVPQMINKLHDTSRTIDKNPQYNISPNRNN